jgi:putative membrane protein
MDQTSVKRALRACGAAITGLLLAACAGVQPADMRMGAAAEPAVIVGKPFTAVERDFVTKVAAKGMYEVEVSRLAAERALNPRVRSYAQAMATQHTQANNELVALMSAHGVAPPRGLAADKATKLHRLAALPRSDAFDNGYIRVVGIEDQRAAIAMFEKARREVHDRDLRAWIERTLVLARNQLSAAENIAGSLQG